MTDQTQTLQYFNYDDIKDSKGGEVTIKCYNNGNKWLCPNPKDEIICERIDQWYNASHGIQYKEISISNNLYVQLLNG
jgi:hypothetical protein